LASRSATALSALGCRSRIPAATPTRALLLVLGHGGIERVAVQPHRALLPVRLKRSPGRCRAPPKRRKAVQRAFHFTRITEGT
jgi:hypothetical protein